MHNYLVSYEISTGKPRSRGVWQHLCGVIMAVLVVGMSYGTAGAQTQPRAYVANGCAGTVSVIDTATNTVITTIPIGVVPTGVAVTPDATRVYVTNLASSSVSVIATATNTVIMRISVENASPDFSRAINGIPPIDTQRALTQVLVGDGDTTVIGGIYVSREQAAQDRTPGLHRIPLLGWLFQRNEFSDESRELLIFITPKITRL